MSAGNACAVPGGGSSAGAFVHAPAAVLPQRQVIGARALEQYNGMLIGTYERLETRSAQIEFQQDYGPGLRSRRSTLPRQSSPGTYWQAAQRCAKWAKSR